MSEEKPKKYNPGDLYATPEFSEENGKATVYKEPEERRAFHQIVMIAIIALIACLLVLLLTGVLKVPAAFSEWFGGPDTAGEITPAGDTAIISEFMAGNKSALQAGNGKYHDWIEIYNPTDHVINLNGFGLTDNPDKPAKFKFPDYSLGSGEFVIVFATGKKPNGVELEAPFKLNASGMLLLTDPGGKKLQQIRYQDLQEDYSYSVDRDDFSKWSMTDKYTPKAPNPH